MRRVRWIVAVLAGLVLGLAAMPVAAAQAVTRVMVVGDSITQGSAGDYTWRYRLWQHLQATAPGAVDLVGDRTTLYDNIAEAQGSTAYLDGAFDRDHHALWGRMAGFEKDTIGAAVSAAQPDVMLVLLGTNDIAWGGTPSQAAADMRSLIGSARTANPGLDVVVGHVPGRYDFYGNAPLNVAAFAAYNSALDQLATDLDTSSQRVITTGVDVGFDAKQHTYDGTHPNPTGEAQIAQAFANGLSRLGIGASYGAVPAGIEWGMTGAQPALVSKDGAAQLSWTNKPGSNAAFIEVRNDTQGGSWDRLPYAIGGPTWTAELLVPGFKYSFRLVPVKMLMTGKPGPASSVTVGGKTPAQPAFLNISNIDFNSVKLTWGASANATGYFIEQTNVATGGTQRLPYPVTGTTFSPGLLAENTSYRWRIIPVNGAIEGPASPSATAKTEGTNPQYAAATSDGLWYSRSGQAWELANVGAAPGGDDGIAVARFFIPYASAGPFKGDDRGFSSSVGSHRRVTVAWKPQTGEIGVSAEETCLGSGGKATLALVFGISSLFIPDCKGAHEVVPVSASAVRSDQDDHPDRNRFNAYRSGDGLMVYGSFANSYSTLSGPLTTPTIDGELYIYRASDGRYHMRWTGNGYPALESTFYPRRASRSSYVIGRRGVQPGAADLDSKFRPKGLYNTNSWVTCFQQDITVHKTNCTASAGSSYSTSW